MAKSVIFPMLKGTQVYSKIKEQTEVQVGCKLGKNMYYQEKRIQPQNLLLLYASSGFSFVKTKARKKRSITSHKAMEVTLCDKRL